MKKILSTVVFLSAAILCGSAKASASSMTIGQPGSSCGTCQGSIYTLTIDKADPSLELKTGDGFDTYLVTLQIDTSGYNGGGARIDEVAVKISSGADQASLTGAPGGISAWNLVAGGISAGGCSGSGSGFECSDWKTNSGAGAFIPNLSQPNPYLLTWTFLIDVSGPVFSFTDTNPDLLPSIKVRYVDGSDNKVGALVSEKVPEPTTLALLGVGIAVATIRRRRTR